MPLFPESEERDPGGREERSADADDDLTTVHVRSVLRGESASLEWLVDRFSPVMLCHARCCLGKRLSKLYDPEDLVQETWAVALPKLSGIVPRGARSTPAVVRFLSTTLVHLANRWIAKHVARRGEAEQGHEDRRFDQIPAEARGVITSIVRRERESSLAALIETLPETDRTILILRGLEGRPAREVGVLVSLSEDAVHQRFSRALRSIREKLPDSLFAELNPSEKE